MTDKKPKQLRLSAEGRKRIDEIRDSYGLTSDTAAIEFALVIAGCVSGNKAYHGVVEGCEYHIKPADYQIRVDAPLPKKKLPGAKAKACGKGAA